jgi:hypothetical protein
LQTNMFTSERAAKRSAMGIAIGDAHQLDQSTRKGS